jgi:hypothetical protein
MTGEPLVLKANVPELSDEDQPVTILNFRIDHHLGNVRSPFVIGATITTDISETVFDASSRLSVFNLSGRQVYSGSYADFDRRNLTQNVVYIFREIKTDGTVNTRKVRIDR